MNKFLQKFLDKWNSFSKKRKIFLSSIFSITLTILIVPLFVNASHLSEGIFTILIWVCQGILWFLNFIVQMEMSILMMVLEWQHFSKGIPAVDAGWMIARDVCNMFFILILLVIAFSTILNYEAYSYKRWLPKLAIAAVLINFSKMITGLMIDFSQVIMLTFVNAFRDVASGNLITGLHLNSLFSVNQSNLITNGVDNEEWTTDFAVFATVLLGVVLLVVVACVLLVMISVVVGRIMTLWILTILSPIAYFLQGSPFGKQYASQWWSQLGKNLVAGPVLAFFLYLALYTIQVSVNNKVSTPNPSIGTPELQSSIFSGLLSSIANASNLLDFVIVIALLMMALRFTQESGAAGAKMAGQMSQNLSKWGKGAARRFTGYGWAADRFQAYQKARKQEKQDKIDRFGAGMLNVEKNIRKAPGALVKVADKNIGKLLDTKEDREKGITRGSLSDRFKAGREKIEDRLYDKIDKSLEQKQILGKLGGIGLGALGIITNGRRYFEKRSKRSAEKAEIANDYKNSHKNSEEYINEEKDKAKGLEDAEVKLEGEFKILEKALKDLTEKLKDPKNADRKEGIQAEILAAKNRLRLKNEEIISKRSEVDKQNKKVEILEGFRNRGIIKNDDFGNMDNLSKQKDLIEEFFSDGNNTQDINKFFYDKINQEESTEKQEELRTLINNLRENIHGSGLDLDEFNDSYIEIRNQKDPKKRNALRDSKISSYVGDDGKLTKYEIDKDEKGQDKMDHIVNKFRARANRTGDVAYFSATVGDPIGQFLVKSLTAGFTAFLAGPFAGSSLFTAQAIRGQNKRADELGYKADSLTHDLISKSRKRFDSMSMTQLKPMINDRRFSETERAAMIMSLQDKGGIGTREAVEQYRSTLHSLGVDRLTIKDFEDKVTERVPTAAIYPDAQGRPMTDGEREAAMKARADWFGQADIISKASPGGVDASLIKQFIQSIQKSSDMNMLSRLNPAQMMAWNKKSGEELIRKLGQLGNIMRMEPIQRKAELKEMRKMFEVYSRTSKEGVDNAGLMDKIADLDPVARKELGIDNSKSGAYLYSIADFTSPKQLNALLGMNMQTQYDGMMKIIREENEGQIDGVNILIQTLFDKFNVKNLSGQTEADILRASRNPEDNAKVAEWQKLYDRLIDISDSMVNPIAASCSAMEEYQKEKKKSKGTP